MSRRLMFATPIRINSTIRPSTTSRIQVFSSLITIVSATLSISSAFFPRAKKVTPRVPRKHVVRLKTDSPVFSSSPFSSQIISRCPACLCSVQVKFSPVCPADSPVCLVYLLSAMLTDTRLFAKQIHIVFPASHSPSPVPVLCSSVFLSARRQVR